MLGSEAFITALAVAGAMAETASAPKGAYTTKHATYTVGALDPSSQKMHVHWPDAKASTTAKFPLISYLHGMAGGGIDILSYGKLFDAIAAFGFVVVAPASCSAACKASGTNAPYTDCAGLPGVQPRGWPSYYGEGLKAIEWAKNQSTAGTGAQAPAVAALVDWSAGVGVAGHSMGGQAAAIIAGADCPTQWDVRAVALHHPADGLDEASSPPANIGSRATVPLAAFTSSGDGIWPETHDIYYNATVTPRMYRDQVGFSHLEPLSIPPGFYNDWLAPMTAAWFKIYLGSGGGLDPTGEWYSMIFNASNPASLCNYAAMADCKTVEK